MIEAFLKCMQSEANADTELPAAQEGVPPAADEGGALLLPALSLACFGCARLPSDMGDDRVKHPMCQVCSKRKLPTMYWCCLDCPGNPGAWRCHAVEGIGLGLPSESALSPRDAPTLATFEEGEGPVPWVPWVSAQAQLPDLQDPLVIAASYFAGSVDRAVLCRVLRALLLIQSKWGGHCVRALRRRGEVRLESRRVLVWSERRVALCERRCGGL